MIQYGLYGFILGFIIPRMARRFAKFAPASAAESVWRLVCPIKGVGWHKKETNAVYKKLWLSYFWRCFVFGCVTAGTFVLSVIHFGNFGLGAILAFLWALLLLLEIDYKTLLLPDVITVPLLIGGFVFSSFYGIWVLPEESAAGAVVGYILPVVAALFVVWKYPQAFGGGDIKLLAAIGAWFGVSKVVYTILAATILFAGFALVMKRRDGAFGPAIAIAGIIVAFYFF